MTAVSNTSRARRFSKVDWLDLGLSELVRQGPSALIVERLCEKAGRTRGSFYHHFADHPAFVRDLLDRWYERQTAAVIGATEAATEDRLEALQVLASRLDHALDLAIRRWSFADAVVAARVADVDAERLAYLESLHFARGTTSKAEAREAAESEYALFVGAQLLWPERAPEEMLRLKRPAAL